MKALLYASLAALALALPAGAQQGAGKSSEPERIRGVLTQADARALTVRTPEGRQMRFMLADNLVVFSLARANFSEVDFGTYVGAVSERLGDTYSPIYRDSLSWLHRGFELRIIDEKLRGIAVGHTKWDLTPQSVMTHGWVDDMEDRVLSIKYGPTDEEETDVEIGRDTPVLRMSLGDRALVKAGAHVVVGMQRGPEGPVAVFVFVGKDGVVPPL